ncbi:MAG: M28 family peptidase [Desulfobacteraceae bacterium]|nr:M28 family peptidase [Desulfobacteraceae bacterium]
MPDKQKIMDRLHGQLTMLTRTIGERSIYTPDNLKKSADYIHAQFEDFGLSVERQTYRFNNIPVCNVLATLKPSSAPAAHYVIGAHYDTVAGTVGADDNASAVAVVLETARVMQSLAKNNDQALKITFAAFTLEEPPAYGTRHMGSRVFAKKAKEQDMAIDGMICLEMVGYTCSEPGCQHYPFPLRFLGYPKTGTFIGIVGNLKSLSLTRKLRKSFKQNPELPVVSLTVPFNGWIMPAVRLSDHASFWSKGYRAVMLTDSAYFRNPHYHLLSDSMQTLDFSYMAELVRSLVLFLRSPHP